MIGTLSPATRSTSGRTVANLLTSLALDPFGRIPEFKFCAVRAKPWELGRRRRSRRL